MRRLFLANAITLTLALTCFHSAHAENTHTAAERALQQGFRLSFAHKYREGVDFYRYAMRLDPQWWEPYYRLGDNLIILDDPAAAIRVLDTGIKIDPKHGELWFTRGQGYYGIGDLKKAQADFDRAIELSPTNARYFNKRGDLDTIVNDLQKALKDYTRAIEFTEPKKAGTDENPDNTANLHSMSYKDRANVYKKLHQYQAAIDDYTAALNSKHYDFHREKALTDRAECYDQLGKHDLANKDRKLAQDGSHAVLDDLMK